MQYGGTWVQNSGFLLLFVCLLNLTVGGQHVAKTLDKHILFITKNIPVVISPVFFLSIQLVIVSMNHSVIWNRFSLSKQQ